MEEFEEIFEDLEDPRTGNAKRHELHEILVTGFCTLLSDGETCADMALFGWSKLEFLQEFSAASNMWRTPKPVNAMIASKPRLT